MNPPENVRTLKTSSKAGRQILSISDVAMHLNSLSTDKCWAAPP